MSNPDKAAKQVNKNFDRAVAKTPASLARAVAAANRKKK